MSFYFENFPEVNYSLKKNFNFELLTNVTVRFKIREVIKNNALVFYEYNVRDDELL